MGNRSGYYTDLYIAFLLRLMLFLGMGAIMALILGGCADSVIRSHAVDLAVKGTYVPGNAVETRNQIPQGGTDEKSGSTPATPTN